jgi:hypothetical protein
MMYYLILKIKETVQIYWLLGVLFYGSLFTSFHLSLIEAVIMYGKVEKIRNIDRSDQYPVIHFGASRKDWEYSRL